jgi:hypothetical protein
LNPLNVKVDAERRFPEDLRDRHDALRRGALVDDPEQHGDPGGGSHHAVFERGGLDQLQVLPILENARSLAA